MSKLEIKYRNTFWCLGYLSGGLEIWVDGPDNWKLRNNFFQTYPVGWITRNLGDERTALKPTGRYILDPARAKVPASEQLLHTIPEMSAGPHQSLPEQAAAQALGYEGCTNWPEEMFEAFLDVWRVACQHLRVPGDEIDFATTRARHLRQRANTLIQEGWHLPGGWRKGKHGYEWLEEAPWPLLP